MIQKTVLITGVTGQVPQSEKTPFYPRFPYAVAKMYAYWITVNYREAYNMYARIFQIINFGIHTGDARAIELWHTDIPEGVH